jgi:uncharacterized protein
MEITNILSTEFNVRLEYSQNIINLIDEDNTIPFIARYRKEMTGGIDDQVLREFCDRLTYLRNLRKRIEEVTSSIEEQGKMTDEIQQSLEKATTLTEVEDIYRPYKKKRKTRASVAIEKGLQPLADIFLAQELKSGTVQDLALDFVNPEKGVDSVKDAIDGARDIVAEIISDNAALRKILREFLFDSGEVKAVLAEEKEKAVTYEMYKDYSEKISKILSHRLLAINRGEKEQCLNVSLVLDEEVAIKKMETMFLKESTTSDIVKEAINDSYKRLIFPSIEREVRNDLTERANERAIRTFEINLKPLLMQPPLKNKTIMGFDPAYRTGCKIAVIDSNGNCLETTVVYPTPPQSKTEEAVLKLKALIDKFKIDVISIGNGTASKESEIFVADMIKKLDRQVSYIIVSEAGASVYSASKLGAEEFPDFDVSLRSAVSIARRLQDPLAELIKIDVKAIGVGQYQHDMPEKRLTEVLDGVVEDCVNKVGVDLNTASQSLLKYVAGLNTTTAKNIIEKRKTAPFKNRQQLLDVPKLGIKAYEQCAGFLRIRNGENILDNTGVHPETYTGVMKLLEYLEYTKDDLKNASFSDIDQRVNARGLSKSANLVGIGETTLKDIINELKKPGLDIRESLPQPILRSDLLSIDDLKIGMEIAGTVRNVIDFGAFIDIGVHVDGLVHISQMADRYINHPSDVVKVGDVVKVKILEIDTVKKKIALTMKDDSRRSDKKDHRNDHSKNNSNEPKQPADMESMLELLKKKFNKR